MTVPFLVLLCGELKFNNLQFPHYLAPISITMKSGVIEKYSRYKALTIPEPIVHPSHCKNLMKISFL
jgi:hypothetical protein